MINILILSVGTRNKIIQYFVKELKGNGRVIATDMCNLAPAVYEADKYYIVPKMTDPKYLDTILDICYKEKIDGVLSLIDPELSLIAKNADKFDEIGTKVVGSNYELCEMSLNKYQMYQWLMKHKYMCAKSYIDASDFFSDINRGIVNYPVFVKPITGSASIEISKVNNDDYMRILFEKNNELIIQEFLNGQEIGADVYIDMISGEVISIFTKKKLKMKAGETDKAVSFKDNNLFDLIEKFVKEAGYRGQIDIDIFDIGGKYYISEVNPRFGGGYPFAYECGVNNIHAILNNIKGLKNKPNIGNYRDGVYMAKYSEIYTCYGKEK